MMLIGAPWLHLVQSRSRQYIEIQHETKQLEGSRVRSGNISRAQTNGRFQSFREKKVSVRLNDVTWTLVVLVSSFDLLASSSCG